MSLKSIEPLSALSTYQQLIGCTYLRKCLLDVRHFYRDNDGPGDCFLVDLGGQGSEFIEIDYICCIRLARVAYSQHGERRSQMSHTLLEVPAPYTETIPGL